MILIILHGKRLTYDLGWSMKNLVSGFLAFVIVLVAVVVVIHLNCMGYLERS